VKYIVENSENSTTISFSRTFFKLKIKYSVLRIQPTLYHRTVHRQVKPKPVKNKLRGGAASTLCAKIILNNFQFL
jgi:CRISPR/Cas system-associated protein Cas5 (RAMP superfamily)